MGKAQARAALFDAYPSCVATGGVIAPFADATIVMDDSIQRLKGLRVLGDEFAMTWRGMVLRMGREMEKTFQEFPRVKTFVMCFDVFIKVTIAKAIEWDKRRRGEMAGEAVPPNEEPFVCGPLDATIPDSWSRALSNREGHLVSIVRFIVDAWTSNAVDLKIPDGRQLIISYPRERNDPNDAIVPVQITGGEPGFTNRPDLAHHLGEGDYQMPFIAQKIADENDVVGVYSVDSDLLFILMKSAEMRYLRYMWRFDPKLTYIANSPPFVSLAGNKRQRWCDVGAMMQCIRDDPRLSTLKQPIASVIAAATAGGGDFTDNVNRVPHHHWIRGLLNNAEYIGDVVDANGQVDGRALIRLTEVACCQAAAGLKKTFIADPGVNIGLGTNAPKTMPGICELIHRKYHLRFAMDMISDVNRPCLTPRDLLKYHYARFDRTQPLSRTNIYRLHGDEAPDDGIIEIPVFDEGTDEELEVLLASPPPAPPDSD